MKGSFSERLDSETCEELLFRDRNGVSKVRFGDVAAGASSLAERDGDHGTSTSSSASGENLVPSA